MNNTPYKNSISSGYVLPFPRNPNEENHESRSTGRHMNNNFVVFMRDVELSKKGAFQEFAKRYNPKCIIDIRIAPRLDAFANSRTQAFKLFEDLHVEYLDFLGRAGINSSNDIRNIETPLLESICELLLDHRSPPRPVVLFFDSDNLMTECKRMLPHAGSCSANQLKDLKIADYRFGLLSFSSPG